MTSPQRTPMEQARELIEQERQRDARVRRIAKVAWIGALTCLLIYALPVIMVFVRALRLRAVGEIRPEVVILSLMPFVQAAGLLSVLVATLATIGIFVRMRTASLEEIRLRLAALEEMIVQRDGSK